MKSLKQHQIALLLAAVLSALAVAVPLLSRALLPLTYLNALLHEMCHAIAGMLTGASIDNIIVRSDGSGVTPMVNGSIWLIGPAGYIGASIIGAATVWYSRSEKGARNTLRTLTVMLAIATLLWVRGDFVGVIAAIGWVAVLGLASQFLKGLPLVFAAQFIGLQQCLNSIQAVYVLLNLSAISPDTQSDAMIMQTHTHIPAFVWAFGWCVFSLVLIIVSLRRAWLGQQSAVGSRAWGRSAPGNPGNQRSDPRS